VRSSLPRTYYQHTNSERKGYQAQNGWLTPQDSPSQTKLWHLSFNSVCTLVSLLSQSGSQNRCTCNWISLTHRSYHCTFYGQACSCNSLGDPGNHHIVLDQYCEFW
jgi:hypothetical protein